MALLAVEEIQPVPDFLYGDGIFLSPVFEDKLFKEQEGTLMRDLLSDLNKGPPCVLGGKSRAVGTLCVLDEELDLEDLLEYCSS